VRSSRALAIWVVALVLALAAGCASKSATPRASTGPLGSGTAATAGPDIGPSTTATGFGAGGSVASAVAGSPDADGDSVSTPVSPDVPVTPQSGGAPSAPGVNAETNLGTNVLVYVSVSARERPLNGTEVVLGQAVFKPDTRRMMDRGVLGPLPSGTTGTLVIYPDGRDGKKISVPLRAPGAGTTDPRARIVDVALSDDGVRVLGSMVLPQGQGIQDRF